MRLIVRYDYSDLGLYWDGFSDDGEFVVDQMFVTGQVMADFDPRPDIAEVIDFIKDRISKLDCPPVSEVIVVRILGLTELFRDRLNREGIEPIEWWTEE